MLVDSAGAPPPRPGRKQPDNRGNSRDRRGGSWDRPQQSGSNGNRGGNRDRRVDGNKKFGNKSEWNSQGGSGGQWGNNWGGNNYGNQGLYKKYFK